MPDHRPFLTRVPALLLLAAVLALVLVPEHDAEARRGFSGFGRTSLRIPGFGRAARKPFAGRRAIGWGRASTRRARASGAGGSASGWGGGMSRRVGTKGRAFGSRREAEGAYRKGLKTRWQRKPASRPDYVPRSVTRDGRRYDVVFNNGRYGYWGPGNAWVALGAGSMLASAGLLAAQGYAYGPPGPGGARGRPDGLTTLLGTLVLFGIVVSLSGRGRRR